MTTLFDTPAQPAPLKGADRALAELRDSLGAYLACEVGELPLGVVEAGHQVLAAQHVQEGLNGTLAMLVAAQDAQAEAEAAVLTARTALDKAKVLATSIEAKLVDALEDTGAPGAFTTHHAVTSKPGSRSVKITDKTAIPLAYLRPQKPAPEREPDKVAIAKALKHGPVAGAELANGSPTLEWINRKVPTTKSRAADEELAA